MLNEFYSWCVMKNETEIVSKAERRCPRAEVGGVQSRFFVVFISLSVTSHDIHFAMSAESAFIGVNVLPAFMSVHHICAC